MKLGIVVEGGAARTFFATGVMDILMMEGIYPDFVIGSGMGINNALSYVSKQYGRSYQIGVHYSYKASYSGILQWLRPSNRCFYNLKLLLNKIPNQLMPFDYDSFNESGCQVLATVTNMQTGRAEYLPIDFNANSRDVITATMSIPVFFPKIYIGGVRYLNGTFAEPISYKKALKEGCDKVIVITSREKHFKKKKSFLLWLGSVVCSRYPKFSQLLKNRDVVYNYCTDRLRELEDNGEVFVIRPDSTYKWKRLEYNPDIIRKMYRIGYNNAKQLIEQIRNYIDE